MAEGIVDCAEQNIDLVRECRVARVGTENKQVLILPEVGLCKNALVASLNIPASHELGWYPRAANEVCPDVVRINCVGLKPVVCSVQRVILGTKFVEELLGSGRVFRIKLCICSDSPAVVVGRAKEPLDHPASLVVGSFWGIKVSVGETSVEWIGRSLIILVHRSWQPQPIGNPV